VLLVKPQFEAGRADVGDGGVVRDPAVWGRVLREVAAAAADEGLGVGGAMASPLLGPAGNVEFLVAADRAAASGGRTLPLDPVIDAVVAEGIRVAGRAGGRE
jgi:23S rRNA (cytidine1920-2'-O)/16S rRNA (cytidine1409-2'-O)-methyltransferase